MQRAWIQLPLPTLRGVEGRTLVAGHALREREAHQFMPPDNQRLWIL